jgi:hypothetical protein
MLRTFCARVAKWPTAVDSRSTLVGVRGFESLPSHVLTERGIFVQFINYWKLFVASITGFVGIRPLLPRMRDGRSFFYRACSASGTLGCFAVLRTFYPVYFCDEIGKYLVFCQSMTMAACVQGPGLCLQQFPEQRKRGLYPHTDQYE